MKRLFLRSVLLLGVIIYIAVFTIPLAVDAGVFKKRTVTTVERLPRGNQTVIVKKKEYHYHGGIFYRRSGPGFVVVNAPVGAVVVSLPVGHTRIMIGGSPFFFYAGVYYQQVPTGYVVVAPPAQTPGSIVVTAKVLNVRSGPGIEFGVIRTVNNGEVLVLVENGSRPDWCYVRMSDGSHGWVMRKFTTGFYPPAEG